VSRGREDTGAEIKQYSKQFAILLSRCCDTYIWLYKIMFRTLQL